MQYEISQETLKKTEKCPRDMQCLKEGGTPLCKVENLVKGNGVFVKQNGAAVCLYRMPFGGSLICHCPTRFELADKYKM